MDWNTDGYPVDTSFSVYGWNGLIPVPDIGPEERAPVVVPLDWLPPNRDGGFDNALPGAETPAAAPPNGEVVVFCCCDIPKGEFIVCEGFVLAPLPNPPNPDCALFAEVDPNILLLVPPGCCPKVLVDWAWPNGDELVCPNAGREVPNIQKRL